MALLILPFAIDNQQGIRIKYKCSFVVLFFNFKPLEVNQALYNQYIQGTWGFA